MTDERLKNIRREYGDLRLTRDELLSDPIEQLQHWFEAILKTQNPDPSAMTLSTVDQDNSPDARTVLLKGIDQGNLIFYTNYQSDKATQLNDNPQVAVTFYWPEFSRQVRIRGRAEKISEEASDNYFLSRPDGSQMSAAVSHQSQVISSRDDLEQSFNQLLKQHAQVPISRPTHWGGYQIIPSIFEFWQGRDNRLHDRFRYRLEIKNNQWVIERLSP